MTQITPKQEILSKTAVPAKAKGGIAGTPRPSGDFSRILMDHLDPGTGAAEEGAAIEGSLPELEASYAARISQATRTAPDLAREVAGFLDQLDTYAQVLADPGKSLRDARGLLEEIDTGLQNLDSGGAAGSDQELTDLLNHMTALVAVEKIKLDRGDYL